MIYAIIKHVLKAGFQTKAKPKTEKKIFLMQRKADLN